ncbi:MAG: DUF2799 domain-containing protein [Bdellovibrionales bacterium]|nr:DUF2799 domain-containing protein [Bdellovibrionales bacterium]
MRWLSFIRIHGLNFALALLALGLTVGCITNPPLDRQGCENVDWYELGRRDGSQGLPINLYESRRNECRLESDLARENLYLNGRNAGLVDFCTPTNGYEMGRTGQIYYYVCPADLEGEFVGRFRLGRKIYQLEKTNQEIGSQLNSLLAQVQGSATPKPQKDRIGREIEDLRRAQATNQKLIEELKQNIKL